MMFIGIADAVISSTSQRIRLLYAVIIPTCFPWSPYNLWNKCKDNMAEDVLHRVRSITVNPELELCSEIHNEVLISLGNLCVMMSGKMLNELGGMPVPDRAMHDPFNREFERKRQYDKNALSQSV